MSPIELRQRVCRFMQEEARLEAGETLVVAVSGGLDSAVLLDVLNHLRDRLGIGLHAAHFDHRLRPGSAADSQFAAGLARARGLPCTCGAGDVAGHARSHKLSLEAAGRLLRYRFLDEVAQATGSRHIALAHHANDQAETVLLRLLRGSGTGGLAAMSSVRQERYVRPLLEVERPVLETYARECRLEFREDPSNRDLRFVRNRVRGELLPHLQQRYNPAIVRVLGRTAQVLRDEDQLLDQLAQQALQTVLCEQSGRKIVLAAQPLLDYHIAVQRRIVRMLFEARGEGPFDFAHVEAVLQRAGRPDSGLYSLGAGWRMQRAADRLILRRGTFPAVEMALRVPGQVPIPTHGCTLATQLLPAGCFSALKDRLGGWRAALDASQTGTRLLLRSPRPGDRFQPLGMSGRKKLSDLLIDRKWPRILRDEILLLICGDQIAWVAGLGPGHLFRVRESTRQILLAEVQWNEC